MYRKLNNINQKFYLYPMIVSSLFLSFLALIICLISIFLTIIAIGIIKKKKGIIIKERIQGSNWSETKIATKQIAIGKEKIKIDHFNILK